MPRPEWSGTGAEMMAAFLVVRSLAFVPPAVHRPVLLPIHRRLPCPALQDNLSQGPAEPVGKTLGGIAALPAQRAGTTFEYIFAYLQARLRALMSLLARADASLVSGALVGTFSYVFFPRLEGVVRMYLELPPGRKGIGSGFTTDVWGAFCPCIGILFATLISSTVDKLWARQESLRRILIEECRELAVLTVLLTTAAEADLEADRLTATQALVQKERGQALEKQQAQQQLALAEADWQTSAADSDTATVRILEAGTADEAEAVARAGGVGAGAAGATGGSTTASDVLGGAARLAGGVRAGDPKASLRCIARHLSTLSRLVWGKAARSSRVQSGGGTGTGASSNHPGAEKRGGGGGGGGGAELPKWARWAQSSAAEETSAAYLAELGSIGGGAGNDPLVDLLLLHPPLPPGAQGEAIVGNGAAWRNANAEAREIVTRLMEARGQRLATLESRPPTAQWVVLTFTGTSLIFAFAVVSISTRPAAAVASRCLFTALTGALLTVLRLLLDLAEPFDGGSYSLATENAAGALLAPTRRRLVAALTTRLKPNKDPRLLTSASKA